MLINLNETESRELIPGFHGKMIHTDKITIAYWEVEAGAEIPEHSHHHEQTMQVTEGTFELTVDGETRTYQKGELVYLAPHVKHGGRAITSCKITDIFCPVREEYR
ncbi:cupin domain-containing protein [Robertkochia solimangrovi]|uniref:cupin domain-containing protein n=1 Tax=Robertkochia solimangrovi TaxID=2213046 RepID=UPI0011807352|nr:cupin domain-containing protein [Robertkochia solimangrovi]TRZ42723.1 cupin domain-containing protein [Robertkochia solimangrovi]